MIFKVVAIKDEVTGRYMQPMYVEKRDDENRAAKRLFNEVINNTDLIKNNPNDYTMYLIAEYDDTMGFTSTLEEKIGTATMIKAERGEQ